MREAGPLLRHVIAYIHGSKVNGMATLTIHLSDDLKRRLRAQAAERGRSMEEEARRILRAALSGQAPPVDLARAIRDRFEPLGGVELDIPPR